MLTSVFMNNRTQAVRLPSIYRFSESTQKVFVRMVGVERGHQSSRTSLG